MDSIVSAADKSKIKIQKIEDNTAAHADILVYLPSGSDAEMMRDALFAFTDCEMSISPNSGVIVEGKPAFLGMTENSTQDDGSDEGVAEAGVGNPVERAGRQVALFLS